MELLAMDPEDQETTEIPYCTKRLDDSPGIPFYIPCRSPLHQDEEWGQGWNTDTDDEY